MSHDPDRNVTMPAPGDLDTDVFGWLSGEGFVMRDEDWTKPLPVVPSIASNGSGPLASVADEVRELEGLLRG